MKGQVRETLFQVVSLISAEEIKTLKFGDVRFIRGALNPHVVTKKQICESKIFVYSDVTYVTTAVITFIKDTAPVVIFTPI